MIWLVLTVVGLAALTVIAYAIWFSFSFKIDLSGIDLTMKPEAPRHLKQVRRSGTLTALASRPNASPQESNQAGGRQH